MYKLFLPVLFLLSTCGNQTKLEVGQIKTPKGEILIWLYDETPNHKQSFLQLAKNGYWDSLTFNRVIPDFVAQGGCPDTPEGFNDPEYLLAPDFNDKLSHEYGAVGAGITLVNYRPDVNFILFKTKKGYTDWTGIIPYSEK